MRKDVEKALAEVRPLLESEGGGIDLVDITDDGVVKVRLTGGCCGCPMSRITLKHGIEAHLKIRVPSVKSVEAA